MRVLAIAALGLLGIVGSAQADEAAIRRNLIARMPSLPPIDEVTKTVVGDLWEVRMGTEVLYSDAQGSFLIQGQILDTERRVNVTEERTARLSAFDFDQLPLQDAVVWKKGSGARPIVVFADPNCGYCKHFEQELSSVSDVTVYTFLIPILGGNSPQLARDIWCASDRAAAWRSWMLDGRTPPAAASTCNGGVLERNLALVQKHSIFGTPTLVFQDGQRRPGILSAKELEVKFASLGGKR